MEDDLWRTIPVIMLMISARSGESVRRHRGGRFAFTFQRTERFIDLLGDGRASMLPPTTISVMASGCTGIFIESLVRLRLPRLLTVSADRANAKSFQPIAYQPSLVSTGHVTLSSLLNMIHRLWRNG